MDDPTKRTPMCELDRDNMLNAAIEFGEDSADKAILYASLVMSLRRRIKSALVCMEKGHVPTAKRLLQEALQDDGKLLKRRLDMLAKRVFAELNGKV